MNKYFKYVLITLLIILTFVVFNEPGPVWFFPLFLVVYTFRDVLKKMFNKIRLPTKYIILGLIFGLFIETLAILSSSALHSEQRALFNPEPIPDLILAIGYYGLLMIGSYFILKIYNFSLSQFFLIGGIFGLFFEEHGGVFLQLLGGNILGGVYVFLSYGSLLALPYALFNKEFNKFSRKESKIIKYFFALLILAVSYILFLLYFTILTPIVSR